MTDTRQPSDEEVVQAIYRYAAQEMQKGTPDFAISQALVQRGLDSKSADTIVNNLVNARGKAMREAAFKNMAIGGVICIVGLVITIGSLTAGGGRFVLAWGAIIFGGVQFFRGVGQLF